MDRQATRQQVVGRRNRQTNAQTERELTSRLKRSRVNIEWTHRQFQKFQSDSYKSFPQNVQSESHKSFQ